MGDRERAISNAKAERFYEALLLLSGIGSRAFPVQNRQNIAGACDDVESMLQIGDLGRTEEQLRTALARLGQIRSMVTSVPGTADEWSALDDCVRECLKALGVDLTGLPRSGVS
jgi:hypothetical protein